MEKYTAGWPEWVIILISILGLVLAVMWLFLPFAINSLQRQAAKQVKLSQQILDELKELNGRSTREYPLIGDKKKDKSEPKIGP
jgi:hypothetical protein